MGFMLLSEFMPSDLILVLDSVASWDELVDKILDRMEQHGSLSAPKQEVFRALKEREALSATLFEKGLAIPHAKIGGPMEITGGMALLKHALEQRGQAPLRLMTVVVTARKTAGLYLSLLAALSSFMQQPGIELRLGELQNAEQLYAEICRSNLSLEAVLCTRHIMSERLPTCAKTDSLNVVLENYVRKNLSYCAVVDKENYFLGELRLSDIFNLIIPDYVKRIGKLNFLDNFEPLKQFIRLKASLTVADVMQEPRFIAAPDTTIVELFCQFSLHNMQNIPVVDSGRLVGHIGVQELLNKVLLEY